MSSVGLKSIISGGKSNDQPAAGMGLQIFTVAWKKRVGFQVPKPQSTHVHAIATAEVAHHPL